MKLRAHQAVRRSSAVSTMPTILFVTLSHRNNASFRYSAECMRGNKSGSLLHILQASCCIHRDE